MRTVEKVLKQQRSKTTFSTDKMCQALFQPKQNTKWQKLLKQKSKINYDFNVFNKGRLQQVKDSLRKLPANFNMFSNIDDTLEQLHMFLRNVHHMPGTIHIGMFTRCIDIMGTQQQRNKYLNKCYNYEIVGCYAQTEIGHGSDVRNLQTTANYIEGKDQFVINSPTVSSAKYWPGQLGWFCTHALVYAQLISKNKNHGIHSFIVPIRDEKRNLLPGIEVGDIGPKIGYHTKDNGYLILHNVHIPKFNMLRRFISIDKKGQIKKKGNQKIGYATMMVVRRQISWKLPKFYAQAIIIATRYAVFRVQFQNQAKIEIPIIQYQCQKDKIISRIAQYYAISFAGNRIKNLCDQNFIKVNENSDFSLMSETHACLCLGKAFISETVQEGMQICRKACGGNGYSNYSGFTNLISEHISNVTLQGENTILYLQLSRYLLKSYKHSLTKTKPIGQSVQYLHQLQNLMQHRLQITSKEQWTLQKLKILISQAICYQISKVSGRIMNKPEGWTDLDVWNKLVGINIKELALTHSVYYVFTCFMNVIQIEKLQSNKIILSKLCRLFGINSILMFLSKSIIQGEFINSQHINSLNGAKQHLLDEIRPNIIGLTDSLGIPDSLIESELIYGNPYENYFQYAIKSQLNQEIQPSALLIRNKIQQVLAKHELKPKL